MPRKPRLVPQPPFDPVHPFDQQYAVETGGLIPAKELQTGQPSDRHITAYYGVAPSILDALIDLWLQTKPPFPIDRYTFLDIGAGKGRAILAASLHPFHHVVGIELNSALAAIARSNMRAFADSASPLAPVELLEGDALAAPLPETPTLAFMFHPFEAPILRKLLARIGRAFEERPGQFDILYVNAEHAQVIDKNSTFRRIYKGAVPMSSSDHLADLAAIATQTEYGSTGDELCAIYRFQGRG